MCIYACIRFYVFVCCFRLISKGINVNERHELGWTALHVAVINGKTEIVKMLLAAGADPNERDEFITAQRTAKMKGLNSLDGKYTFLIFF